MAAGSTGAVSVVGMIHGLLFLAYVAVVSVWRDALGWLNGLGRRGDLRCQPNRRQSPSLSQLVRRSPVAIVRAGYTRPADVE